jgi:flagellar protein FlgJ
MTQISQNAAITGTATAATQAVDPALAKAAKAFEAIFMRQMIGSMRSSSLSDGLLDSSATSQFRDMADARTADDMAAGSHLGIANLLLKQLSPASTPGMIVPNPDEAGATS